MASEDSQNPLEIPEMVEAVLRHLDVDQVLEARMISKTFNAAAHTVLRDRMEIRVGEKMLDMNWPYDFLDTFPTQPIVKIPGAMAIDDHKESMSDPRISDWISIYGQNVTQLELDTKKCHLKLRPTEVDKKKGDMMTLIILQHMTKLRTLNIYNVDHITHLFQNPLPRPLEIQELGIFYSQRLVHQSRNGRALGILMRSCNSLKRLTLSVGSMSDFAAYIDIAIGSSIFAKLEQIDLADQRILSDPFRHLFGTRWELLEEVRLPSLPSHFQRPNPGANEIMQTFFSRVSRTLKTQYGSLPGEVPIHFTVKMQVLRKLQLVVSNSEQCQSLSRLEMCPNLLHLFVCRRGGNFTSLPGEATKFLEKIFDGNGILKSIKTLRLENLQLGMGVAVKLTRTLPSLTILEIGNTGDLHPASNLGLFGNVRASLIAFSGLEKLRKLSIYRGGPDTSGNDVGVVYGRALENELPKFQSLEELNLDFGGRTKVDQTVISRGVYRIPNLKKFNIHRAEIVGGEEWVRGQKPDVVHLIFRNMEQYVPSAAIWPSAVS